jgi:hypothetical protein
VEPQSKDAPTSAAGGLFPVVRACNEVRRLPSTLPPLIEYARSFSEPTEIIVDDGSVDGTGAVAAELGRASGLVTLLHSGRNAGKGASVRRGMLVARYPHVLFTAADLSAPIQEAGKLRAALARGADVDIGSRRVAGSDIRIRQSWLRGVAGCVVEVPIVWRDDPRSHVGLLRDSGGMLLDLGRVRVDARAGRYGLDRGPAPDRARWMGKERSQTPLHDE